MAGFREERREDFVDYWAEFVRLHSDIEWSRQQNVLINSQLQTVQQFSRKEYLEMKGEKCWL